MPKKETRRHRRAREQELLAAKQSLNDIRDSMLRAYSIFNNSSDLDLVEASILEISALQSRYSHTLREVRSKAGVH